MRCGFRFPLFFALGLALNALGLTARADDWPYWRGPQRNGISQETQWQDTWTGEGPPVIWKAKVGLGFSSLVVSQGRIFTMGHGGDQDRVFCFNAESGQELWRHEYPADLGDKYFEGGTTGTPTVAGDRVYTLSRWGDAFCFEAATGKVIWSKNVQPETGAAIPDWGFGGAPLVVDGTVLLNVGEAGLALEASTGALRWKSKDGAAGYSTPLPLTTAADKVVFSSGTSYTAVDRRTGAPAWQIRWLTQYGVNAADPIVDGTRIFLSTGYGKGGALFDLTGAEPKEQWKTKALRTQMNPAVLYSGHLYGVDGDTTEKASLKCLDVTTGVMKWTHPGFGSGAVIVAGGKLIGLGGTGELFIAPAVPTEFATTTRVQVLGGKTWTTPVLANGRLYCRNSRGDVICLDLRRK